MIQTDRPTASKMIPLMPGHWVIKGFGLWADTKTPEGTPPDMLGPLFPEDWPEPDSPALIYRQPRGTA